MRINPENRKFELDSETNKYFTDALGVRGLAGTLNAKAKTFKLGNIFRYNSYKDRVEVSVVDYEKWKKKIRESKGKRKKQIKAENRKFELDSAINKYSTDALGASNLASNLNRKARAFKLGRIFHYNSDKHRVELSVVDYEKWQQKIQETKGKRKKPIKPENRKFELDSVINEYFTAARGASGLAGTLNSKAKTFGLDRIFSYNSDKDRVELSALDYHSWLEAIVFNNPQKQHLLDELNSQLFAKGDIRFGISHKYLELDNDIAALPYQPGRSDDDTPYDNIFKLSSLLGEQDKPTIDKQLRSDACLGNGSVLKHYSALGPISSKDKVTFVFAGRGKHALFPDVGDTHRVVAVLTKQQYDSIKLGRNVDALVIEALNSKSHGAFKSNDLGLINSRRIAAMMFAHKSKLSECIFIDDNIASLNVNSNELSGLTSKNNLSWSDIYNKLKLDLKGKVCTSIATNQVRDSVFKDTLGSKLFMVDINKLKSKFSKPEDMFCLFPPAPCANWWGEDYFMQIMMAKAFGIDAVSIMGQEAMSLTRSKAKLNSCVSTVKKANIYLNKEFDSLIDRLIVNGELSNQEYEWIKATFNKMQQCVQKNVDYQEGRFKFLSNTDLFDYHARANSVEYIQVKPNKRKSKEQGSFDERLNNVATEILDVNDGLYNHQREVLNKIINFDGKLGLIEMATGTGKTRVQIELANLYFAANSKKPIIIVAPTQNLVKQFYDDFIEQINFKNTKSCILPYQVLKISSAVEDINVQLLKFNKTLDDKPLVLLFCLDSFMKYMEFTKRDKLEPSILMLDESHKLSDAQRQKITSAYSNVKTISLTATPKNNGLADNIYSYKRKQAVKDGVISPFICDKLEQVYPGREGMYSWINNELANIISNCIHPCGKKLNELKGILYLPTINHAEAAQKKLKDSGIKCYVINSKTGTSKQDIEVFKAKSADSGTLAIAVGMMRVGFSDPKTSYAILGRSAKKEYNVSQVAGRVMRKLEGNKIGYMLTFDDANLSNFDTLCDDLALESCDNAYLQQSGRSNKSAAEESKPPLCPMYERSRQSSPRYNDDPLVSKKRGGTQNTIFYSTL